MANSLWDLKLSEFRDVTASSSPTPGGGSVSVVTAVFGMSLIIMALEVSLRNSVGKHEQVIKDLISQCRQQMKSLSKYADVDVAAFEKYMKAVKMPKGTDKEKTRRSDAMQKALEASTLVPLEAAQTMIACMELSRKSLKSVVPGIVSDVDTGALLIDASFDGVLQNIPANLEYLKDEAKVKAYDKKAAQLDVKMQKEVEKFWKAHPDLE